MNINPQSSWDKKTIEGFLHQQVSPARIACIDNEGFPAICSLWFFYDNGTLWCASHKKSHIVRLLNKQSHCGFEISDNNIPYKGVRGKGVVSLDKNKGPHVLQQLIERYLGNTNQALATWLNSRSADEYAIGIEIENINAWDFSSRMQ